jgi:glycosyltransferase involved in cell wall biosynthesis
MWSHSEVIDIAIELLSALEHRREIRLAFVGEIGHDPEYYARLQNLIVAKGVSDRVVQLGFQEDMRTVLAASDVVLACGDDEGLGLATLEAMAAGVPTVVRGGTGAVEAVQYAQTGWIAAPADLGQLINAVAMLLENREMREQFGGAGRRRCREMFGASASAERLTEIYEAHVA